MVVDEAVAAHYCFCYMADETKSGDGWFQSYFAHLPMIARGGIGIALRAIASKPEAVDMIAQSVYLDEFDGEPEVPWEKLPAKEKKVCRQRVKATLEGLDKIAKAATTG